MNLQTEGAGEKDTIPVSASHVGDSDAETGIGGGVRDRVKVSGGAESALAAPKGDAKADSGGIGRGFGIEIL